MRTVRLALVCAAFSLVAIACGDDDGTTTTAPSGGGVATTTATTAGSIGGGGNGSVAFEISGGYEATGEFPFIPAASAFSNGGWSATFSEGGEAIITIGMLPGQFVVSYGDASAVITAGDMLGCAVDVSQNDSSGFAGSFDCDDLPAFLATGASIVVDFSGTFTGHP